jgi:DNA-binding transcriptional LysR family regulator
MDVLLSLRTFAFAARYGGFSEAARRLHVVPSVVAKRITQLEKVMDTRLFERTTRKVELTDAGQRLQAKVAGLLVDFDEVVHSLQRNEGELEGHIRLMAPTTLTLHHLGDVLNAFLGEHQRITLEVVLMDRSISPIEEGFDVAISGRAVSFYGVIDLPLCPVNALLCAAPAYLACQGMPSHPRELKGRDCLVFRPSGSVWAFQSARGLISVDVSPRLVADDNQILLNAAKRGYGIAALPAYIAKVALATGALRPVLAEYPLQENWFRAYIPAKRQGIPRVTALVEWLVRHLQRPPFTA